MTAPIPPHLLPNLRKYKYSAIDKSLVSKYFLQPFWEWLVTLFPLWMAPNMITLLGLLCTFINVLTLLYFSPNLLQPCPGWVYWSFGVGLFAYQSLDAIDGKQARRTGTSSPLGQLFDHGCDALNTSFGVLLAVSALNMGGSWLAVLTFAASTTAFYLSTWEEFHTSTLYLGYINGPVEGLLIATGMYIWTGIQGPLWWSKSLSDVLSMKLPSYLASVKMNEAFAAPCLFLIALNLIASIVNIRAHCRDKKISIFSTLPGLIPYALLIGSMVAWLHASPYLLQKHIVAVILAFGICFGNMVGQMIVKHVTHDKFPYFNLSLMPLIVGAIVSQAREHAGMGKQWPITVEHEIYYVYGCLSVAVYLHTHFVLGVIGEICRYLDIYCLTIKQVTNKKTK